MSDNQTYNVKVIKNKLRDLYYHIQYIGNQLTLLKLYKFISSSCCNMNNHLPLTTSNSPEKCSYHVHLSSAINFSRKIDFGLFNTFNLHL